MLFNLTLKMFYDKTVEAILKSNNEIMLSQYGSHIIKGWEDHYLSYDYLKLLSKGLRETTTDTLPAVLDEFYRSFLVDVGRIHEFHLRYY